MEEDATHVEIVRVTMAAALAIFLWLVVLVAAVPILRVPVSMRVAFVGSVAIALGEQRRVLGRRSVVRSSILVGVAVRSGLRIHRIQASRVDDLVPERGRMNGQVSKTTVSSPRPGPAVATNLAACAGSRPGGGIAAIVANLARAFGGALHSMARGPVANPALGQNIRYVAMLVRDSSGLVIRMTMALLRSTELVVAV